MGIPSFTSLSLSTRKRRAGTPFPEDSVLHDFMFGVEIMKVNGETYLFTASQELFDELQRDHSDACGSYYDRFTSKVYIVYKLDGDIEFSCVNWTYDKPNAKNQFNQAFITITCESFKRVTDKRMIEMCEKMTWFE